MQASEGAIETVRARRRRRLRGRDDRRRRAARALRLGADRPARELRRTGAMTPKGVFADRARQLEIVPGAGITFSRADASALAQAKAANTVGQQILLRELGVEPAADRPASTSPAASPATSTSRNAIAIGFLVPVPAGRVTKVGNASLRGARELLLSVAARDRLEPLAARVEHSSSRRPRTSSTSSSTAASSSRCCPTRGRPARAA